MKDTEAQNSEPKKVEEEKMVSFFSLYRYAEVIDNFLLILGIFGAIGAAISFQISMIFLGEATNGYSVTNTDNEIMDQISTNCIYNVYAGVANFILSAFTETCWTALGERLGIKVRELYLKSILKQSVPWFDQNKPQELPTKISSLINSYQSGIGGKVGKLILTVSMTIAGIVIGFVYGWHLALVILGLAPFLLLAGKLLGFAVESTATSTKTSYQKCGGYAEEALSAVKTVYAFCAEETEKVKYFSELKVALDASITSAFFRGAALGIMNCVSDLVYGIGFFVGAILIEQHVHNPLSNGPYTSGVIFIVLWK